MRRNLALPLLFLLVSCSQQPELAGTCATCHSTTLDVNHQIECTVCHGGNNNGTTQNEAHADIIAQPAHPDNLSRSCGKCHEKHVNDFPQTLHFTLANSVNMVRTAFDAAAPVEKLTDIEIHESIDSIDQLADDMLRRRCLRCHLFSNGDSYTLTSHATGCGACHMLTSSIKSGEHTFLATPTDSNCLYCHYGNRVGFDYYGRSEHDFNEEYRTPYTTNDTTDRPFGVEYHQLAPDIHQQNGLACVDCHGKKQLMQAPDDEHRLTCTSCHLSSSLADSLPPGVRSDNSGYLFISKTSNRQHILPTMEHSAHVKYDMVNCQVCHAQWSFNDTETHLLRSDLDEYDSWSYLTVQGSSEVEHLLTHNLDFDNEELPPETTDKITGELRTGVWYKGYTMRRWETLETGYDSHGVLQVLRPILNLRLSWVDEDENVRFDSHPASGSTMTPYIPHTTGPAGLYYEQRLNTVIQKHTHPGDQALQGPSHLQTSLPNSLALPID